MKPIFVIHGGLNTESSFAQNKTRYQEALARIAEEVKDFCRKHSAVETAVFAVSLLEDDPLFNAGSGSVLQGDGRIRMSASVMDGSKERFAGVINIEFVKNPVRVAEKLLEENDRVLAGALATEYARGKGFGPFNTETDESRAAYEKQKHEKPFGTVGCVVMDAEGRLAAATSTGGKGFEIPGRVSDSATVAGNYADIHAAVSCTGTGEDIVNGAVAARFVTRIGDGMTLEQAAEKAEAELKQHKRNAGFIAITAKGAWVTGASSPFLPYAAYDGKVTLFS